MKKFASLAEYYCDFSQSGTLLHRDLQGDQAHLEPTIIHYSSNDVHLLGHVSSQFNSLYADWTDIALAAYVADRTCLRDPRQFHDENWVRNLHLKIGVRNVSFWKQRTIRGHLDEILGFLSDDRWQFDFTDLEGRDRFKEFQPCLDLNFARPGRAALYSGGLDSFAGASCELLAGKEQSVVLISCATNERQGYGQKKQIEALRNQGAAPEIIHVTVQANIDRALSQDHEQESSQRTRGFLFSTLGSITALRYDLDKLEIYENGVGAINLPYDSSQVGAMSSRSVNPIVLDSVGRLARKISGRDFRIENPYIFVTKGEMCSKLPVELLDNIATTFSCDGFPVREAGKPQCGVCTSCLLRRMSLESAELAIFEDGGTFGTDLSSVEERPSDAQLEYLRAMEWHYGRLDELLRSENPWSALISEFPNLYGTAVALARANRSSVELVSNRLVVLYKNYCREWKLFSARYHVPSQMRYIG